MAPDACSASLGVGYRESIDLSVADGATSNQTDNLWISEGALNKTGPGTLALPPSNLTFHAGGSLVVREGSLLVQGSTASSRAAVPCPDDVMASAAFWVDATTNVITVSSNGNAYADAWLDVRETNTVAPFTYTRAVASFAFTNCSPQLLANAGAAGTMPSVWFGRYNSLRTMTWTTPANATADIGNICHVFAVHGVFQSYGYVFGANSGNPDFHIQEYTGGSMTAMLWHPNEWSTTALRQGRTYLDGERVDGTATPPKQGWQLLEVALDTRTAHASNFFNDRNITLYGKRIGGDYLCEVAVFTNRLSETDRFRIQHYLMQKWLGVPSATPLAVRASASGTVIADVESGVTQALRLSGDGTLRKQGTGQAVLDDTSSVTNILRAAYVEEGTLDARVPVPLALAAGSRVATSNTAITVTLDAGDGQITKEGPGTVTVTSLPEGLSRVNVNGGVLILSAAPTGTTVAAAASGSVPNATFEAEQLTSYRRTIANGETYYGWTASFPAPTGSADNAVFIFNRAADATKWPCNYDAPEGLQVLALKQDASVTTTLSLPAAGIYDVSFYSSARSFLASKHEFDLCIVDGDATNRLATVQTFAQPYAKQVFRLPWLEAGDHTLLFHRTVLGVDTLGTIDNVKVTLVTETPPATVTIPNGDFELTEYSRNASSFTTSNVARGWVFTAATNGEVSAGITMQPSSSYFYTPSTPYGAVMLGLASNGCAWTSVTLPAGTYKLRGDICTWPCSLNGKTVASTQSTKATITRTSGDSVSLSTVSTAATVLTPMTWPTAFTVTNNETVILTLSGQTTSGSGLIDNLALVPQTTSIVQNGNFEASSNWSFVYDTAAVPNAGSGYNTLSQSNDYGLAIYDGTRRVRLTQTGAAVQDIQIPQAGLYRLVFHAASRVPLTYGNTYGRNPVRAWLAQSGVTNVIGWTRVDDAVLVRRDFLFQVTEAGTYTFGLQGMTDNSPEFPGTDQNALLDGVSIEPADDLSPAGIPLSQALAVAVASGARLQLSYSGTQTVDQVSFAGHLVSGVISQETCPAFVSGPGALYASPKGTLFLLR